MKRLPLAAQISIVFILATLVTNLSLSFFVTGRLDSLYQNRIYENLEAEAKAIRLVSRGEEYIPLENYYYIKYFSDENIYYTSDTIPEYIDDDIIGQLIAKALEQRTYSEKYENTVNGRTIYYVVLNYQGILAISEDVTIVFVDGETKTKMINDTRKQMFYFSLFFFAFGYIIILIWISGFAKDTKDIANALKKIGDNYYKTKITTKRKDEVGDLADSIEHMRQKIVKNERLRQEVIQGVSHDLKTPIAIISSYTEAYEDGMCDVDEMTEIIKRETKRLNAKVSKLLNLTRLGYIDTNLQTVGTTDMKDLIIEIIGLYNYQDKIKLIDNLREAEFVGDRESWFIAVQNILDNALRYAQSEIKIDLEHDILKISNDGINIPDEMLTKIFEAFEKGEGGVSGIGLSIVKRTVELFGYKAEAKNLEGGVCFTISKT